MRPCLLYTSILHPLALLRRVWASMDTFQLQVTLLFTGAVFLLWLAYGALRPVDGEKQELSLIHI